MFQNNYFCLTKNNPRYAEIIDAMQKDKILIVDDEEDLREILSYNLRNAGYDTIEAPSAEQALRMIDDSVSLIILDVMMAGMNGFDMVRYLRQELHNNVPVIFLTAKDRESDMLKGFARGGDDYITKPFSLQEVMARVKAVLRRVAGGSSTHVDAIDTNIDSGVMRIEGLVIDNNRKVVSIDGEDLHLSPKEFGILYTLASHPGHVFSREEILDAVWKGEAYVLMRTIDVHIARLRHKLGPYANRLHNRQGYGYCFE